MSATVAPDEVVEAPIHPEGGFPVISIFSGAGGMDLGVADIGGSIRVCVEAERYSAETLRTNSRFFPDAEVIERPIEFVSSSEILKSAKLAKGEAALLVGGPPCQPFSKSGYWLQEKRGGVNDGRAWYLGEYLRVLRDARPEAFILENVPSLLHAVHREEFEYVVWRAKRLGYSVDFRILHAPEYGVPQGRARVFLIGLKGKFAPTFPVATHWWHTRDTTVSLQQPETAGRWIAAYEGPEFAEEGEVVEGRWADALRAIPPGSNYKYLTEWAGHPDPLFVTETKYWSFLLKLSPNRPSWTIQASPGKWTGPFHWSSRRLRISELAALQTFPRDYQFSGGRGAKVRQIGNAVPSRLATAVAEALMAPVLGSTPARGRLLRYRLSSDYPFEHRTVTHVGHRW